jgi:transposase-like protein
MKNKSELESLSPQQKMAVLEFVRGKNLSYKEIAEKVNVSTRTLYNWRQDSRFRKTLEQAMSEVQAKVVETTGFVIGVNMLSEPMFRDLELANSLYIRERLSKLEKYHSDFREIFRSLVEVIHELDDGVQEIKNILTEDNHANNK